LEAIVRGARNWKCKPASSTTLAELKGQESEDLDESALEVSPAHRGTDALLETQKNIAEEKLAQQDDLVQAAVAAALREAADYAGTLQDCLAERKIVLKPPSSLSPHPTHRLRWIVWSQRH
jgi:hypothetical protein